MNVHCECPAAGWCDRHKKRKGPEQHKRCNGTADIADCGLSYWNAWEQGRAGATAPAEPKLNPEGFCAHVAAATVEYKSSVGDVLSEVIKRETGIEIPCAECQQRIEALNAKTVEECRADRGTIIADLLKRAPMQAPALWQRIALAVDSTLCTGVAERRISSWVDEAIQRGAIPKKKMNPADRSQHDSPRAKAATAAKAKHVSTAIKPQSRPTEEQTRLYRAMMAAPKPSPRPFRSEPRFNLVWHFWPVAGTWEWHADRLRDLLPTINGRKIIGIVTDHETVEAREVIDRIGDSSVEYILNQNVPGSGDLLKVGKPYGEVITAEAAFQRLRETGDSITLYGHAKGARIHTRDSEAVRLWSEMMYETVTFAHAETIAAMESGYQMVGAFRTFGFRPLVPKHRWHYSGTFFNFRTQEIFKNRIPPIQQKYGGTEAWPGDVCKAENAFCTFGENSPWLRQYDARLMHKIIPDQLHWESDRYGGGPKMEQHVREFRWLAEQLRECRSLLVIGSRHGGLEHHLTRELPQLSGKIVAVDCDPLPGNTSPRLIVGSSHDQSVQEWIRKQGPFDAVFIDGDHTYDGAKLDWLFALSMSPRKIFFHDFTDAAYHRLCGCEVHRLWSEIEPHYVTATKAVGCGWGGIAMVDLRGGER